jgi:hypothetical protein
VKCDSKLVSRKLPGLSFPDNCNRFGVSFHFVNEFGSGKREIQYVANFLLSKVIFLKTTVLRVF